MAMGGSDRSGVYRAEVEGHGRMVRVRWSLRVLAALAAALVATTFGWVLFWTIMSPSVLARVSTGPLTLIIVLQVLPLIAFAAWRIERAQRTEQPERSPAAEAEVSMSAGEGEPESSVHYPAAGQAVLVHRVVHAAREGRSASKVVRPARRQPV